MRAERRLNNNNNLRLLLLLVTTSIVFLFTLERFWSFSIACGVVGYVQSQLSAVQCRPREKGILAYARPSSLILAYSPVWSGYPLFFECVCVRWIWENLEPKESLSYSYAAYNALSLSLSLSVAAAAAAAQVISGLTDHWCLCDAARKVLTHQAHI